MQQCIKLRGFSLIPFININSYCSVKIWIKKKKKKSQKFDFTKSFRYFPHWKKLVEVNFIIQLFSNITSKEKNNMYRSVSSYIPNTSFYETFVYTCYFVCFRRAGSLIFTSALVESFPISTFSFTKPFGRFVFVINTRIITA